MSQQGQYPAWAEGLGAIGGGMVEGMLYAQQRKLQIEEQRKEQESALQQRMYERTYERQLDYADRQLQRRERVEDTMLGWQMQQQFKAESEKEQFVTALAEVDSYDFLSPEQKQESKDKLYEKYRGIELARYQLAAGGQRFYPPTGEISPAPGYVAPEPAEEQREYELGQRRAEQQLDRTLDMIAQMPWSDEKKKAAVDDAMARRGEVGVPSEAGQADWQFKTLPDGRLGAFNPETGELKAYNPKTGKLEPLEEYGAAAAKPSPILREGPGGATLEYDPETGRMKPVPGGEAAQKMLALPTASQQAAAIQAEADAIKEQNPKLPNYVAMQMARKRYQHQLAEMQMIRQGVEAELAGLAEPLPVTERMWEVELQSHLLEIDPIVGHSVGGPFSLSGFLAQAAWVPLMPSPKAKPVHFSDVSEERQKELVGRELPRWKEIRRAQQTGEARTQAAATGGPGAAPPAGGPAAQVAPVPPSAGLEAATDEDMREALRVLGMDANPKAIEVWLRTNRRKTLGIASP